MVCIYCGEATSVNNSRHQKRINHIWRRRSCLSCDAVFTTTEEPQLEGSLVVVSNQTHTPEPLLRDRLFVDVYESCKHRSDALRDASALTNVIIGRLLAEKHHKGAIERDALVAMTHEVLRHFDKVSATFYLAYHPIHDNQALETTS